MFRNTYTQRGREMGSDWNELNLLGSGFLPKTMSEFLTDLSMIDDDSVKETKLRGYLHVMEEELRKIGAFKRELPFCMLLLNDAFERLQTERVHCTEREVPPVMTEFLPLKGNSDDETGAKRSTESSDKKNWMSSAQLWTTGVDQFEKLPIKELNFALNLELGKKESDGSEFSSPFEGISRNGGGAFLLFKGQAGLALSEKTELSVPVHGGSSSRSSPVGSPDLDLKGKSIFGPPYRTWALNKAEEPLKKQRRCWSPELHRQFVDALERLGGAHKATPKQIKELMEVEGLSNDEIKSHLQKYRLHVRKVHRESSCATAPSASRNYKWSGNGSPEGHQVYLGESSKRVSITCGSSMEYDGDEKSDDDQSHSWRGLLHKA